MDDFTAFIGQGMICQGENTKRLYELEEETIESLKRAAQELRRFVSADLSEDEATRFTIAEELFVLLDFYHPEAIHAATAFLRRFGKQVTDNSAVSGGSTPAQR